MRRIAQLLTVLATALLPPAKTLAQGTIVYQEPAQPLSGLVGLQVDLDGNGQIDISFYNASYPGASRYATGASGDGTAQLLVTPQGPYDLGSYLVPLGGGFSIGGSPNEPLMWAGLDAPNLLGSATVLGSYFPEDISGSLHPIGYFYGVTAFTGIHFQIGSDWHYGWLRIRGGVAGPSDDGQQFFLNPPGWVLDWAYESRPDTPIFAGAVPEPTAWTLVVTGLVALSVHRRHRSTRERHRCSTMYSPVSL